MKKAIQINLGGRHFHIDEDAYLLLKEYTDSLRTYFSGEGDAGTEIIDDIEHRLAELLEDKISGSKEVVILKDVEEAIQILGKIEDFEFESSGVKNSSEDSRYYDRKVYRRLHRDPDNSYLGGVCSGLGAYFNVDPLWMRIIFIALIFANGFGILLYVILWIIVPKAITTAQKLQMKGEPVTVQNIQRSIGEEYRNVRSNFHNFSQSEGFRKTRNAAEEVLNAVGRIFVFILKFFIYFIGIALLVTGLALLLGFGTAIFTHFYWFRNVDWPHVYLPNLNDFFTDPSTASIVGICLIVLIAIPIISLMVGGIKLLLNIRSRNHFLRATALTAWILALIIFIAMLITEGEPFVFQASDTQTSDLKPVRSSTYYLKLQAEDESQDKITVYSIFDYDFYYDRVHDRMLGNPSLEIVPAGTGYPQLVIKKSMRNLIMKDAGENIDRLDYDWLQSDSLIIFDRYFSVNDDYRWRFPEVDMELKIPENQKIRISSEMMKILGYIDMEDHDYDTWDLSDNTWVMTVHGLRKWEPE